MREEAQKNFEQIKKDSLKYQNELNEYIQNRVSSNVIKKFNESFNNLHGLITERYNTAISNESKNPDEITSCIASMQSLHDKIIDIGKRIGKVDNNADRNFLESSGIKFDESLSTQKTRNKRVESFIKNCTVFCIKHQGDSWQDKYHNMQRTATQYQSK